MSLARRNRKNGKSRAALEPLEPRRLLSTAQVYQLDLTGDTTSGGVEAEYDSSGSGYAIYYSADLGDNPWSPGGNSWVAGDSLTITLTDLPAHTMIRAEADFFFDGGVPIPPDTDSAQIDFAGSTGLYTYDGGLGSVTGDHPIDAWKAHSASSVTFVMSAVDMESGDNATIRGLNVFVYNPTVTASSPTTSETAVTASTVTVSRDTPSEYGLSGNDDAIPNTTVTVGGTATNGTDFTSSPSLGGTVTLTGQTNKQFDITPKKDNLVEGTETLTFTSGGSTVGTLSISDNPPSVTVEAIDDAADEPDPDGVVSPNNGTFRLTRSGGDVTAALLVSYTMSGSATEGADYESLSGTVTILENESFADVIVTPKYDYADESNETITLQVQGAIAGTPSSDSITLANKTLIKLDAKTDSGQGPVDTGGFAQRNGTLAVRIKAEEGDSDFSLTARTATMTVRTTTPLPAGATLTITAQNVNNQGVIDLTLTATGFTAGGTYTVVFDVADDAQYMFQADSMVITIP